MEMTTYHDYDDDAAASDYGHYLYQYHYRDHSHDLHAVRDEAASQSPHVFSESKASLLDEVGANRHLKIQQEEYH
jgi:hypothetical protein